MALTNILDDTDSLQQLSFANQRFIAERDHYAELQNIHSNRSNSYLPVDTELIVDILEGYLFQVQAISTDIENDLAFINNNLTAHELELDGKRNRILSFELKVTYGSLAIDAACMLTSLLGMNVYIPNASSVTVFFCVVGGIMGAAVLIFVGCLIAQSLMERQSRRRTAEAFDLTTLQDPPLDHPSK